MFFSFLPSSHLYVQGVHVIFALISPDPSTMDWLIAIMKHRWHGTETKMIWASCITAILQWLVETTRISNGKEEKEGDKN